MVSEVRVTSEVSSSIDIEEKGGQTLPGELPLETDMLGVEPRWLPSDLKSVVLARVEPKIKQEVPHGGVHTWFNY